MATKQGLFIWSIYPQDFLFQFDIWAFCRYCSHKLLFSILPTGSDLNVKERTLWLFGWFSFVFLFVATSLPPRPNISRGMRWKGLRSLKQGSRQGAAEVGQPVQLTARLAITTVDQKSWCSSVFKDAYICQKPCFLAGSLQRPGCSYNLFGVWVQMSIAYEKIDLNTWWSGSFFKRWLESSAPYQFLLNTSFPSHPAQADQRDNMFFFHFW